MENYPAPAVEQMVPQKKRTWLKPVIRLGIFGVVALIAFFVANPFTASSTEVGACLKGNVDNADSVENIECGTPDANFKVVGKQENKSEIGLRLSGGSECDDYPTTDAYFFQGKKGATDGTLLCLEDLKNPGERAPVVGDCLPDGVVEAKKLTKADCATARYKVLAIEKSTAFLVDGSTVCTQVPSTDEKIQWQRSGGTLPQSRVLCLDDLKK
ncbi:hypothetical protein [Amycolatopsis sp. EV170708-02-1]|uniref:LppU/SCO3897 family protein n=1 Tax=Amycolatopsis sp. EV170708-02-1 TaxID=2919322 RepID=UPI001F0C0F1E|nr:hypothetical protein [Amycolatopsis sp. EV170708-02-1]UMP05965.1 hypothetical protein MJQ72_14600 [Amycolatopsis sp. EV170708-02-1]